MQGSLGEKLGEGHFAEVHAWAPGQVVKLFKAWVPERLSWWEARMTRAVFAAGGPAPQVLGEITLEGRFGMILPRLDGPTLLDLSRSAAMPSEQVGAILAAVAMTVHQAPPPAHAPSLRDSVGGSLRDTSGVVPDHIATGVLALIDRLTPGDGLCQGDLNSGNVIMTAEGPRLIDWLGAVRAPAAYDLACCHVIFFETAPEIAPDPERPIAVGAAMQAEYARLAGVTLAALTAEVERYLPIARLSAVFAGAVPTLRERLIQRIEAALGSD